MARKREAAPGAPPPEAPDFGARVARLDLKPGEILVATLDASIASVAIADHLRDYIAPLLPPGVKLLIVDDRVSLSVINPLDAP